MKFPKYSASTSSAGTPASSSAARPASAKRSRRSARMLAEVRYSGTGDAWI